MNIRTIIVFFISFPSVAFSAGIGLNKTRIVFSDDEVKESLEVKESSHMPWMVSMRIVNAHGETDKSMIVIPPLFRLEADGKNKVLIIRVDGQKDNASGNERLHYVEVNAVPSSERAGENELRADISISFRIKLFNRPASLPAPDGKEFKRLFWAKEGTGLRACNPSPYYFSLNRLEFDGKKINLNQEPSMVGPESCVLYPGHHDVKYIKWSMLNDFGGDSGLYGSSVAKHSI